MVCFGIGVVFIDLMLGGVWCFECLWFVVSLFGYLCLMICVCGLV